VAKVLACPACGNKHPLDLLVGLDSFQCRNCGKKLAVPSEVNKVPEVEASKSVSFDQESKDEELRVVARSSLSPLPVVAPANKEQVRDSKPKVEQSKPSIIQSKSKTPTSNAFRLGAFSKILSWLIALPLAFFIVVIFPRLFGRGFHASDFVGVITNPGLGRYSIVVTLIFLWSIVTVALIPVVNFAISRFLSLSIFKKKSVAG
jgi:hypothetical protein